MTEGSAGPGLAEVDLVAIKAQLETPWSKGLAVSVSARLLIAEVERLHSALRAATAPQDGQESLRVQHARKQGAADGFQAGWHAALTRIEDKDTVKNLRSLVPAAPQVAQEDDEEEVPHPFRSRTHYEPGDDRDIWCADCEYHRDYKIHAVEASRLASPPAKPRVICLCGSTRFIDQFAVATWELELRGVIVLGCTLLPHWFCGVRDHFAEQQGVKVQRDDHHKQKIDMADEVLVLDIGGYIGESTRNEIAYAEALGKPVSYVSKDPELLQRILPVTASPPATTEDK